MCRNNPVTRDELQPLEAQGGRSQNHRGGTSRKRWGSGEEGRGQRWIQGEGVGSTVDPQRCPGSGCGVKIVGPVDEGGRGGPQSGRGVQQQNAVID